MAQYVPMKIGRGTDFRGVICGEAPLEHRPYQYWLLPEIDKNLKMCVQSCPEFSGPPICLYEPDGSTLTTFCYQSIATNRQGLYCLPKQYNSQIIIRQSIQQPLLALQRYLSDFIRTLPSYFFSLVLTFLFSAFLKIIRSILYPYFIRSILTLAQIALTFFCIVSFLDYRQQVSAYCINSIDKYSCLTPYYIIMLSLYVTLLVLYFIVCALQWNTIYSGTKVISQHEILDKVISKIGFSVYLHSVGMLLLLSFCIFTCYCILSLYGKQQLSGIINGGILYILKRDQYSGALLAAAFLCIIVCILTYLTMIRANIVMAVSLWHGDKGKENNLLVEALYNISRYRLGSVCKHALLMPLRVFTVATRGKARRWLDRISIENFMYADIESYEQMANRRMRSNRTVEISPDTVSAHDISTPVSSNDIPVPSVPPPTSVSTTINHICFSLAVISSCLQLALNRYWLSEPIQFSLCLSILIIPLSYLLFQSIWTRYAMCYCVIHNLQN